MEAVTKIGTNFINYIPFRGELEMVSDVKKAEIALLAYFLEVTVQYEFACQEYNELTGKWEPVTNQINFAATLDRRQLVVGRTVIEREFDFGNGDKRTEYMHVVELKCGNWDAWLHMSEEDSVKVYRRIAQWQFDFEYRTK